mmetsp:Transcript_61949/g.113673  ORF Transcript_61949/g.113673 Transcript_61949/m.113673 type:complete len:232 (+) Transcript_61949:92-787(+)
MRVLAIALACFACTGHGRRVRTASQGPTNQVAPSGQVGESNRQRSLASLLLRRGGYSSFDESGVNYNYDDMDTEYGRRGGYGRRYGYARRGNSWLDGLRGGYGEGGYGRRGYSGSYGYSDGYARRGHSWFDGVRGGYGGSGYGRRGYSGVDGYGSGYGRRGYSGVDDVRGGYSTGGYGRRGYSEYDGMRRGYGRRGNWFNGRRGRSWFGGGYDDDEDEYDTEWNKDDLRRD